jgi:integrase/recombinase XerC
LAALPKALTDDEVNRLLNAFPPELPSCRRGYAMVRCALDLGLRASEIAKLSLADIDWQAGTVTLQRTKSRREDILPLPISCMMKFNKNIVREDQVSFTDSLGGRPDLRTSF